ncbi:MAG: hypothetical protein PHR35_20845 [Kiritimatiellae bacterium]|nr:hypothetical protein [Kiritimatiellia bacterium]
MPEPPCLVLSANPALTLRASGDYRATLPATRGTQSRAFTPPTSSSSWQGITRIREIEGAVYNRWCAVNRAELQAKPSWAVSGGSTTAGTIIQGAGFWNARQQAIASLRLGGEYEDGTTFNWVRGAQGAPLTTWPAVNGLSALPSWSGTAESLLWKYALNDADATGPRRLTSADTWTYGYCQTGDRLGNWLIEDMQAALDHMRLAVALTDSFDSCIYSATHVVVKQALDGSGNRTKLAGDQAYGYGNGVAYQEALYDDAVANWNAEITAYPYWWESATYNDPATLPYGNRMIRAMEVECGGRDGDNLNWWYTCRAYYQCPQWVFYPNVLTRVWPVQFKVWGTLYQYDSSLGDLMPLYGAGSGWQDVESGELIELEGASSWMYDADDDNFISPSYGLLSWNNPWDPGIDTTWPLLVNGSTNTRKAAHQSSYALALLWGWT